MKNTRTNKNHNNNKITKKYVFISLLLLTLGFISITTAIYLQPSHYKGDTFTNAKSSISSTTSTASTSSSSSSLSTSSDNSDNNIYNTHTEHNSAEVENNYSQETNNNSSEVNNNQSQETNNNSTTQVEQNTGDRAYQPTFKVECVSPKNDLYCVEHIPTGDKTKAITYEQADAFCKYMEQIAYGKTSLSHTMDENYNTWNGGTEQQSSETNE